MTHRALRQCAPRFELNIQQRALQPMAAVTRDSLGSTFALATNSRLPNPPSPRGGPTRLLPHLYLGGVGDAQAAPLLEKFGIRRVLNVAAECECKGSLVEQYSQLAIEWRRVDLQDHSDEDIASHFEECLRFIHDGIRRREPVLVHCRFGVSRSATIVMAYLMRYGTRETAAPCPMRYDEVFDFVKARRPQVSPNLGFVLALHAMDEKQHAEQLQQANKQQPQASSSSLRIMYYLDHENEEEDEEEPIMMDQAALAGPQFVCATC